MYAPLSADLWRSPATPVYVAFVTFIRQIALVTRFSGQYEPFCSAFYVFLRCVCLVALHFTVFSVLLTIFFLRPAQLCRGGNGYYTAEKYFLYLFRRFIDKQKG